MCGVPSEMICLTSVGQTRRSRSARSEERRVGKECRSRWWPYREKKKKRSPRRLPAGYSRPIRRSFGQTALGYILHPKTADPEHPAGIFVRREHSTSARIIDGGDELE